MEIQSKKSDRWKKKRKSERKEKKKERKKKIEGEMEVRKIEEMRWNERKEK